VEGEALAANFFNHSLQGVAVIDFKPFLKSSPRGTFQKGLERPVFIAW
jgi:hypothetical protein